MLWKALIAFALLAAGLAARADDKLPLLKVGSEVFTNVTVTKVTATDLYFTCSGGMANAKLKKLSPELQKRFHYDPAKANEAATKQAEANAQYRAGVAQQPTVHPPAEDDEAPPRPMAAAKAELSWGTDFPEALNRAKAESKMVLLDFTGSDWCPWCIKFDSEVLSTDKFARYAGDKLVLMLVDFPHNTAQSHALKQANAELARKYRVDGYPTYVVLNSEGNEVGRQTGYAPGGPEAFIAELEGFSKR